MKKNTILMIAAALLIAVAGFAGCAKGSADSSVAEAGMEISGDSGLDGDVSADPGDGQDMAASMESDGTALSEKEREDGEEADDFSQGEAVPASSEIENMSFAEEMKLAREQVRAKNKETLLGIVNSATLTDEQKQTAIDQIVLMTDIAERETAAEILLESKGFTDVVVSITDNMADVVLNMGDITDAKRAQIEDIVRRKANINPENIFITPIGPVAEEEIETPHLEGIDGEE